MLNTQSAYSLDTYPPLTINRKEKEDEHPPLGISDLQIWQSFRNGNERAYAYIYEQYVKLLLNYGTKFCKDSELVNDCVHDFFLYLREHRERLGPTTSIKFYLMRSFRRRLFIDVQKQDPSRNISLYPDIQLVYDNCQTRHFIEEDNNHHVMKLLNQCLHTLASKERQALMLYYYQEMSYKDIAGIMQFTHISSARRLIYLALRKLKDSLTPVTHPYQACPT